MRKPSGDGGFHTQNEIAKALSIHYSTWGRWVAAGLAPEPYSDMGRGLPKLYTAEAIASWADAFASLVETKEAA